MKVAHLILAHKNPDQVERLIRALKHPAFYFFIHVDKKSDEKQFNYLGNQENTWLIRNRTKIYWAGYCKKIKPSEFERFYNDLIF